MPRPHMPLHIVGVGHICPAGKCAQEARAATRTVPTDENEAFVAPRGLTERPEGQSSQTDQPHPPTQAELAAFWADEPIQFTNPEGTQQ